MIRSLSMRRVGTTLVIWRQERERERERDGGEMVGLGVGKWSDIEMSPPHKI